MGKNFNRSQRKDALPECCAEVNLSIHPTPALLNVWLFRGSQARRFFGWLHPRWCTPGSQDRVSVLRVMSFMSFRAHTPPRPVELHVIMCAGTNSVGQFFFARKSFNIHQIEVDQLHASTQPLSGTSANHSGTFTQEADFDARMARLERRDRWLAGADQVGKSVNGSGRSSILGLQYAPVVPSFRRWDWGGCQKGPVIPSEVRLEATLESCVLINPPRRGSTVEG